LVLKRLVTQACVETAVEPLPPPLAGELRQLQLYRPDAFIDVSVGFQPPQLAVSSGTTLRVNPAVITGRLVIDVAASQGTVFALDMRVHEGWLIDRVEAVPADALEERSPWTLTGRQLRVRLQRAVRPDKPLRLQITAHRRVPTLPMSGKDFRILDFTDVQVRRNLVALCPETPYHFDLSRDAGLQRLDRAALKVPEQTLLDAPQQSLCYVDDPSANALAVGLSWEDPRYSATIAIEAAVESQRIKETFRIRCVPQASRVARLRSGARSRTPTRPGVWSVTRRGAVGPPRGRYRSDEQRRDLAIDAAASAQ